MEVLVLADLYNTLWEYERAIGVIRGGIRWLQGRREQGYWERCRDDREFDLLEGEGGVWRAQGPGDMPPGRYPLDINARHRLAVSRIKMGDIEEAKVGTACVDVISRRCDSLFLVFSSMRTSSFRRMSSIMRHSSQRSRMPTLNARCMLMHARYTSSSVLMLL